MVALEQLKNIIAGKIENDGYFLVDVKEKPRGNIQVFIDSNTGVQVGYCADLSRFISGSLGELGGDYGIEVSSPGLGQPFKVIQQYRKCIGREVEVALDSGSKVKGVLLKVDDRGFVVREESMRKPEGGGRKELHVTEREIDYGSAKSVKEVIKF